MVNPKKRVLHHNLLISGAAFMGSIGLARGEGAYRFRISHDSVTGRSQFAAFRDQLTYFNGEWSDFSQMPWLNERPFNVLSTLLRFVLLIGFGIIRVLVPKTVLVEKGYRTLMRWVASASSVLAIATGFKAFLAAQLPCFGELQTVLGVVCLCSLLLSAINFTTWASVDPLHMATGLNILIISSVAQFALSIPALLAVLGIGRILWRPAQ